MKAKILFSAVLTLALLASVVALSYAQHNAGQLSSREALALIRTMSSVEQTMKFKDSSFGSLEDVIKFGRLNQTESGIVLSDSSSGNLKDYRITVIASADGQHYQVSIRPSSGCGPSFFSNESGLIYQGQALGCPTQ